MSEENVELVRRAFRANNERDFETLRSLHHPDAEYHGLTDWPDRPRVVRVTEEMERGFTRLDENFDDARNEPLEFIDAGDRGVNVLEFTAIGKQSRAPVSFTEAFVTTISDGLIIRIEACGTREKALEVAGLSE